MAEREGAEHSPNVSEPQLLSDGDQLQAIASEPSMTACFENTLIADGACQTTLDFSRMMDEAKKTEHRLKMKVARQKNVLQTLHSEHDEVREHLQSYENNKQIQDVIQLFEAAVEGIKQQCSLEIRSPTTAKKKKLTVKTFSGSVHCGRRVITKFVSMSDQEGFLSCCVVPRYKSMLVSQRAKMELLP